MAHVDGKGLCYLILSPLLLLPLTTACSSGHASVRRLCSTRQISLNCAPLEARTASNGGVTYRTPGRGQGTTAAASIMASIPAPAQIVEHVVLLKVKEGTAPESIDALVTALRGLRYLDMVLELTAGPVLKGVPSEFTHALHSRYKDKADLGAYQAHPDHVDVVVKHVLPLSDNILSIDWEATPEGSVPAEELGALRIALLKPKEGVKPEDFGQLLESLTNYKGHAIEASSGTNFTPARAQGYQWGFLLRFDSAAALEEFSADPQLRQLQEAKVKPLVESLLVVDLGKESVGSAKL